MVSRGNSLHDGVTQGAGVTEDHQNVVYEIDDEDRLVYFNAAWSDFARANHAAALTAESMLHCSLWEFIGDHETRLIYDMLFSRVRGQGEPLHFTYRCDTPTHRRFIRMELQPRAQQHIRSVNQVVREEERPYTPLLDPTQARSHNFLTICSWCKRVELPGGTWVEVEEAVDALDLFAKPLLPMLSHGICLDCLDSFRGWRGKL